VAGRATAGRSLGGPRIWGEAERQTDPLLLVFLCGQVGRSSLGEGSAPAKRRSGKDQRGH
jgi:hypothetical protein